MADSKEKVKKLVEQARLRSRDNDGRQKSSCGSAKGLNDCASKRKRIAARSCQVTLGHGRKQKSSFSCDYIVA